MYISGEIKPANQQLPQTSHEPPACVRDGGGQRTPTPIFSLGIASARSSNSFLAPRLPAPACVARTASAYGFLASEESLPWLHFGPARTSYDGHLFVFSGKQSLNFRRNDLRAVPHILLLVL